MLTKYFVRVQAALASDEGATAVEYGLLLIIIAAVAALITPLRTAVVAQFQAVLDALSS